MDIPYLSLPFCPTDEVTKPWAQEVAIGTTGTTGTTTPSRNGLIKEIIDDEMATMNWAPGKITIGESKSSNSIFPVYVRSRTHWVSCCYWVTLLASPSRKGIAKQAIVELARNKPVVEPVCNQVWFVTLLMCLYVYTYYICTY